VLVVLAVLVLGFVYVPLVALVLGLLVAGFVYVPLVLVVVVEGEVVVLGFV
jgi:hypothetical protein